MTEYGNGIYLDDEFDFEIDASGDIRPSRGIDELEKDLAFFSYQELSETIGRQRSPRTLAIIKDRTQRVLLNDPRVDGVIGDVTVYYPESERNQVEVSATVSTVDGEQELVFPVSNIQT
jgi:hypothetical protein